MDDGWQGRQEQGRRGEKPHGTFATPHGIESIGVQWSPVESIVQVEAMAEPRRLVLMSATVDATQWCPQRVAVVFTHPDVDHILGNQAVPLDVPRLGDERAQEDILAQAKSLTVMRLTIHLGHLLWQTLQLLGGPRLLPWLPSWAQPKALEIFRFAHYAFKLGGHI
eukprot:Skav224450  [mRNA]  locus=scaffold3858:15667:25692:+ [translate_table: standard]